MKTLLEGGGFGPNLAEKKRERKKLPAKRRVGRPSLKNPDRISTICRALEIGLPLKVAGELAGVSESAVYDWRSSDETFSAAIAGAIASGVAKKARALDLLCEHSNAGIRLKAITWWLDRRAGSSFQKVSGWQVGINMGDDSPVDPVLAYL